MSDAHDQTTTIDGIEVRQTGSAQGGPIVVLDDGRRRDDWSLTRRLADEFRVFVMTCPTAEKITERERAARMVRAARGLNIEDFTVLCRGDRAATALRMAVDHPEDVRSLVLVGPTGAFGDNGEGVAVEHLHTMRTPALVLFGSRDVAVPRDEARLYPRHIPVCFYTVVYDAGHDIDTDRPDALHRVVDDFARHGVAYVMTHETSVISP